jgi:hypothetical protein
MDEVRQENTAIWVAQFRVLYSAGYIGPVRNDGFNSFKRLILRSKYTAELYKHERTTINRNSEMLDVASGSHQKQ